MDNDESERIVQQLAKRMADDMIAALCGSGSFVKPQPTALRVTASGAFEFVDFDDDGKRPTCPFWRS